MGVASEVSLWRISRTNLIRRVLRADNLPCLSVLPWEDSLDARWKLFSPTQYLRPLRPMRGTQLPSPDTAILLPAWPFRPKWKSPRANPAGLP